MGIIFSKMRLFTVGCGLFAAGYASPILDNDVAVDDRVFTDFEADNIDGKLVKFSDAYAGRVSIVVNVASE